MRRRDFLYLVGGVSVGSSGLLAARNDWNIDKTVSEAEEMASGVLPTDEDGEWVQEFGFLSPGFEKIEFVNLNVLRIHFGKHDMDGFGIRHASLNEIEDDIYVCEAPKSTGTRDIPLVRLLKEDDAVYPSRKFNLVAYEGTFSECGSGFQFNVSEETVGTASFVLPEQIAPPSAFKVE